MSRRPDLAVATFNVAPEHRLTAKYDRLGPMALRNRRMWCRRHGYPLHEDAEIRDDRPACWAKLTLIADLLAAHEWVLWADSDALVLDLDLSADRFCDGGSSARGCDLVAQSWDAVSRVVGVPPERARARMPVNTGIFLIRSSAWSRDLLQRADAKRHLIGEPIPGRWPIWNGLGDQEALNEALLEHPADLARVRTVDDLQCHPLLYREGTDLFVHFHGNHAAHRIPEGEADAVLAAWEDAVERGGPFPADLPTFHWCCIQNRSAAVPFDRGGPERFLYPVDADGRPAIAASSRSAASRPSAASS